MRKRIFSTFFIILIMTCGINTYAYGEGYKEYYEHRIYCLDEISELSKEELAIARNEIYARKGYSFKKAKYKKYFKSFQWYEPENGFQGLNYIDRYNVSLIRLLEKGINPTLKNIGMINYMTPQTVKCDLNSDGISDTISFELSGDYPEESYILTVNDKKVIATGQNLSSKFTLIDIDKNDRYIEVAIAEDGPSNDPLTTFYYYDGNDIINIGMIQGNIDDGTEFKYDGNIVTRTRGDILHTWFYKDYYKIDNSTRKISNIPQKIYDMNSYKVTILRDIDIYKKQDYNSANIKLSINDKVKLVGTDNKQWIKLENESGEIGWLRIDGFCDVVVGDEKLSAWDVFEGLCYAD